MHPPALFLRIKIIGVLFIKYKNRNTDGMLTNDWYNFTHHTATQVGQTGS
jgi:hypothetical protein